MNAVPTASPAQGEDQTCMIAEQKDVGVRLDAYITTSLVVQISRSRIKTLIKNGAVYVNSTTKKEPSYRIKPGDEIAFVMPEPDDSTIMAQDIPLEILYEDNHLIVINKPAGMVVHPAPGNWSGTLVNALLHHCGNSLAGIGGTRRPGIVHRLDKDTTGIMVVAKSDEAHSGLAAQFADHGKSGPLERAYYALVWGTLERNTGVIDAPLGRSPRNRIKRGVVRIEGPDARPATTHFKVIQHLDGDGQGSANVSLVECVLETGRTHQIRVHMSYIGHPLLGDQDYGKHYQTKIARLDKNSAQALTTLNRQALHAHLLGFKHPVTGETLRFEAPIPADFENLLQALKLNSPT